MIVPNVASLLNVGCVYNISLAVTAASNEAGRVTSISKAQLPLLSVVAMFS